MPALINSCLRCETGSTYSIVGHDKNTVLQVKFHLCLGPGKMGAGVGDDIDWLGNWCAGLLAASVVAGGDGNVDQSSIVTNKTGS